MTTQERLHPPSRRQAAIRQDVDGRLAAQRRRAIDREQRFGMFVHHVDHRRVENESAVAIGQTGRREVGSEASLWIGHHARVAVGQRHLSLSKNNTVISTPGTSAGTRERPVQLCAKEPDASAFRLMCMVLKSRCCSWTGSYDRRFNNCRSRSRQTSDRTLATSATSDSYSFASP